MTGGSRMPTWKERENNKRRERRRRAIAAKVFAGLRLYGNYKLPKHCDNNEVLKALCDEAGWTVDPDGTTYRKGCSRPPEILGGSASASPCSSYHPSPASSSVINDGNSLIPWLRNLSSSKSIHHHYMHGGGSISAPVTPPLSSPTARTPCMNTDWDDFNNNNNNPFAGPGWAGPQHPFLPMSTPPSPGRQARHDQKWFDMPESGPTSPTFSLVSKNPFGFTVEDLSRSGSRMCTPGQSGTCSPGICGGASDQAADVPMAEAVSLEFAFGSNVMGIVKPWEGERIHEEFGSDELELTLGGSKTR